MSRSAPVASRQASLFSHLGRNLRRLGSFGALCCLALAGQALLASGCGAGPGGYGIGFAADENRLSNPALGLQIARVYLPEAPSLTPFVELHNFAPEPVDWAASGLVLLTAAGQVALPTDGTLAPQASMQLRGSALEPLQLAASAGQLLLAEADLTPTSFVAWGLDPNGLRSGLAAIARQGNLPLAVLFPLPASVDQSLAFYFGDPTTSAPSCAPASVDLGALAPGPCAPSK